MILLVASTAAAWVAFDPGPHFPGRWDRRVVDLVAFVEEERGHTFRHPVSVYFLTPEEYRLAAGGDEASAPTSSDRKEASDDAAAYRALGLLSGAPDLIEAGRTLSDSGTLAFYSPTDKVVNVRGTEMTVGLRVTLVHELTHALQDQYFDLAIVGLDGDDEQGDAVRSVIEGDAISVENAYVEQLPDDERADYESESAESLGDANGELGGVPDVLQTLFGAYYALGSSFVRSLEIDDSGAFDRSGVDAALRRPPVSSEQLMDPRRYHNRDEPTEVTSAGPEVSDDDVIDESGLGASFLFLMLSERIDPLVALTAVDGWEGDAYRSSRPKRSDPLCVDLRVAVETDVDAEELFGAFEAWAAAMPSEAAAAVKQSPDGRTVDVRSCDPGAKADVALTGRSQDALALPVVRLDVATNFRSSGAEPDTSWCLGQAFIERVPLDVLASEESTPEQEKLIEDALEAITDAC